MEFLKFVFKRFGRGQIITSVAVHTSCVQNVCKNVWTRGKMFL